MKKIIAINTLGLGGAERVIARLSSHKSLSDVEIVTFKETQHYDLKKNNTVLGSFKARLSFFWKLNKADVVQAHLNSAILWSLIFKFLFKNFEVQTVHCFAYSSFYKRKGLAGKFHKLLFTYLLKGSSLHIFKAEEMLIDYEQTFGWKPKNYKVIHNPYDIANIVAASRQESEVIIDDKSINVAIVGRLSKSKRPFDVLLIADSLPSYNFHFIGDGNLKLDLQKSVKEMGLQNVFFHGSLQNPFPVIKKCGFYLSSSESEGFPNALVEALIVGAICVQSDCLTGPKEILNGSSEKVSFNKNRYFYGPLGLLFETANISAAVSALRYAVDNRNSIVNETNAKIDSFIDTISLDAIAKKYSQCLQGQKDNV